MAYSAENGEIKIVELKKIIPVIDRNDRIIPGQFAIVCKRPVKESSTDNFGLT